MLSTLRIRHIGVIDDATLGFGPGFTALTGETGAGKTMIVTGLTMLLGGRLDRGRAGTAGTVDGTLVLDGHDELVAALDELGAEDEAGEVLVVRRVTRDGRSRAQIGGVPVPIGTLARLVGSAVTVHGQSDQARLREPEQQREALDRFAQDTVGPPLQRHRELWARRQELQTRVEELESLVAERDRRGAQLRTALERLEEVDPQEGEDEQLRAQLDRLNHAVDLRGAAEQASVLLLGQDEGPAAGALLDLAIEQVRTASGTDRELSEPLERLESLRLELSDVAAELSRYADGIDASPGSVEQANERLHEVTTLLRDLGPSLGGADTIGELLEASRGAAADLDRFDGAESELTRVQGQMGALQEALDQAASDLSAARREAADRLARAVETELVHLEMPQASLAVDVSEQPARAHGCDRVVFLLAPHPGADHLPVATAASGGELSRVMLALEVALGSSREDRTAAPVFVFDEIDAGIGGRAALAVGQRLQRLAEHAQVIVVTHLPQVAAHASTHLQIVKHSEGGETSSTVETLDEQGRIRELARMLSGETSELALAHARELLQDSASEGAP
ncbi:DNA repair protein RecN [Brachybacterium endophyticum]|uniref:DNA repair protein RecN n=1 Tax=Brachybacterium endophyticum TaxID=2182385 RepID=A0A2U2RJ98_9MICO|nr:DNA repair protein RecN [Brachybacterium endophyticum]PWH05911.1 DNA repair protein RecN [Brachybacterium endophyticum]